MVGEQIIAYHARLLQQTLLDAPDEGWDQLYILGETDMDAELEIEGN